MMKSVRKILSDLCLVLAIMALLGSSVASATYKAPNALIAAKDGKGIYVAEVNSKEVSFINLDTNKVEKSVSIDASPGGMALSPDGKTLYVAAAVPQGKIVVMDASSLKILNRIAVGHTPTGLAISPDGAILYVCNRFNDSVGVVDLAAGKQVKNIRMSREPVAAAISNDGKTLFVANHLNEGRADGDYAASKISVLDTATDEVTSIPLPNGAVDLRDACISADGKYVYFSHIQARYQLPTTQLERGWMNTNGLSIIDVATKTFVNTVLLDDVDLGAANPWGIACSPDNKYICVTTAGTHEVSVIDQAALHAKLDKVAKGEKVSDASSKAEDVPNDLAFLVGIRRRLALEGNGPRGVVVIGDKAYAAEYFSDSVGVVNIDPAKRPEAQSIKLYEGELEMPETRLGERHFNDADFCFQKWQSCASCHPDTRTDGLNWDLLNDGMGNPKSSRSMFMSHQTPPAMVTGVRPNAEVAVRAGLKYIQFAVRPEEDAVAIDTYLRSLEQVPSPYLVDGKMTESAERGKEVFEKAKCSICHPAPLFTDKKKYNIGVGIGMEEATEFDVPTLLECWRTAPYLYDSRAGTMKEVFMEFNANNKHGDTKNLSEKEIEDLANYVLSL